MPRGRSRPYPLPRGAVRRIAFSGLLAMGLAACATPPPADDPEAVADFKEANDPIEPTNRAIYDVTQAIDSAVIEPVARAYRYAVPQDVRTGIGNMMSNLGTPVRLGNDILSGKPKRAGDTMMRFVINTTAGGLGFLDLAKEAGYPPHDADFGLTMGSWGVDEGPYLFLPIVGPSGLRDGVGRATDTALDPFTWVGQGTAVLTLGWSRFGLDGLVLRERVLDPVEKTKKTALDPYATFRSLYRQYRASQVRTLREDNRATIPVWFPARAGQEINPPPR